MPSLSGFCPFQEEADPLHIAGSGQRSCLTAPCSPARLFLQSLPQRPLRKARHPHFPAPFALLPSSVNHEGDCRSQFLCNSLEIIRSLFQLCGICAQLLLLCLQNIRPCAQNLYLIIERNLVRDFESGIRIYKVRSNGLYCFCIIFLESADFSILSFSRADTSCERASIFSLVSPWLPDGVLQGAG